MEPKSKYLQYYDEKTKVITVPETDFNPNPNGIGCELFQCMKLHADKIAQVYTVTGEEDTYASLLERCVRTAIEIKNRGITENDVICLCSENQLNSAVPFIAAMFLGIKTCSLDPTSSIGDCVHLLNNVEPKIIFASKKSEELIEKAIKQSNCDIPIVVYGETTRNQSFAEFLTPKANEKNFAPKKATNLADPVLIVSSSGTTGLPKAILLSHQFLLFHIEPNAIGTMLAFASLYWNSMIFSTIMCILSGTIKVVSSGFEPKKTWEIIEKFKVELLFLTAYETVALIRNRPQEIIEKTPLKFLAIGGSFIPAEHLIKAREVLPKSIIWHMYGQTECPFVFESDVPLMLARIGCMGTPGKARSYKIVDPDTEEVLGYNQRGELRVKTKYCMSGFYNRDSSDAFDEDGFLKTGDVAYYDEEFCFYIVDRIKEMFKYRTYHIVPAKIESILLNHPDVKTGVIVGLPNIEDDNHVMAVVQLVDGAKSTPADIEKYVNERVGEDQYLLRGGCKVLQDMPFTPSGKIRRRTVRDMFKGDSK